MIHTLSSSFIRSLLFHTGKMARILESVLLSILFLPFSAYAISADELKLGDGPNSASGITTPMQLLTLVENVLLWGILPVVVVGVSLYVAYQLFTAEGDATKLKNAWKTLLYSAVGIIVALLSYALIKIASTYSIF